SGDVSPDPAEDPGTLKGPEASGNFLLHLSHPDILLRLIVAERNPEVVHKVECFGPVSIKPLQKVSGFSSFRFAPLILRSRPDLKERILVIPESDSTAVTGFEITK